MRKLKTSDWLLTLAVTLGLAASASAQESEMVQRADAILGGPQNSLIQQINADCAPGAPCDAPLCDTAPCDGLGCDSVGCADCYLWDGFGFALQDFCDECSPWNVGGWIQSGYHNRDTSGTANGGFNNRPGKYGLHQAWFYAEKVADGSCGLDWGGRMDVMYGLDANDTQAFGNNPGRWDYQNGWDHGSFGFAMPQLYGEVAYGDWSIIAGHFYTLLGYEVVTAPDNFFYSHAFTMYNSEAFTHTGALATLNAGENFTIYTGWTLGWDTGFDQWGSGSSFLGGYSIGLGDRATFTHIITAGDFGNIGNNGFSQSIVVDVNVTDKLNYVFQSDILEVDATPTSHDETVGVNQYLIYSVNECFGVGGRAEWWKANGDSQYAITGGVNFKPSPNTVIRPEIRYQWNPGVNATGMASDGRAIFGVDAIMTF